MKRQRLGFTLVGVLVVIAIIGVHVLMGDGAVKFVTDSIEAGNQNSVHVDNNVNHLAPGLQSPFGLWRALGTRAAKETQS